MKVFSVNNVYTILDDKVLAKEKCVTVLGKRFFFEAKLSPKEADNISAAIKKGKKVKTKPFLPNRKVILPKFQPQYGGKSLAFIRTHYLNENLVKEYLKIEKAGLELAREYGALITLLDWWAIAPELNKTWITGHGDAQEVSAIMHIKPELINIDSCPATSVNDLNNKMHFTHLSSVKFEQAHIKLIRDIKKGIPMGGFGGIDSQKANAQWGKEMLEAVVDYFVELTEEFRRLPLDK